MGGPCFWLGRSKAAAQEPRGSARQKATYSRGMEAPARLVLYDGVCGLCDRTVQWLLANDKNAKLLFAPLQGPTAAAILGRHPEVPAGTDSVLFVENVDGNEQVTWRSRAIFEMSKHLVGGWRFLSFFAVIPSFLSDVFYRIIASNRYSIWGKLDACRVPTPEEKARFLP